MSIRRTWILIAVSLATFMTYLDNNIVNVAMPAIQRDLHLSTSGLEWAVSGYVLVFAGLLLAGGRLGDIFGRRRLFVLGLAVFTAASLSAGLAGNVDVLVASRAVQGLGAALVTPATLALISANFAEGRERTAAFGVWSAVGALSLAIGPLLGGVLSQHVHWSWIFFINVPIGVATIVLGWWALPSDSVNSDSVNSDSVPSDTVTKRERTGLDLPGLLASAATLFPLTYALIEGGNLGWTSAPILACFAVALAAAAVFVLVERRADDPMVDVALFRERVFAGGVLAVMMWGFGLFGIYFFTSLYLQDVLGFEPTEAGAAFVPMALLMAVGAVFSGRVSQLIGAHRTVGLAMALMGVGIATVSLLGRDTSYLMLMPSFALIGVGGGLSVPLTSMVVDSMPTAQAGVASGIFNAAREVSGLLGITVIGAILTAREHADLRAGAAPVDAFLSGYRLGLVVAGALVLAGGVAAFIALRNRQPEVSGDFALAA